MKKIIILPSKCKNCFFCKLEEKCTNKAVYREEPADKPWIDFFRCTGCLKCKFVCPYGATEEVINSYH
jgi:Fe-S-cluster-containing hydrogenase component 2